MTSQKPDKHTNLQCKFKATTVSKQVLLKWLNKFVHSFYVAFETLLQLILLNNSLWELNYFALDLYHYLLVVEIFC